MSGNAIDSIAPLAITMSNSISNSGHSNFRGNNSRVELGDGLGGSRVARVAMADSISNGGHSNFRGNDSRVEFGDGLVGSRVAGVALADSISRGSLVSPQVVAVLKSSNSKSISIRGISTPLANAVSLGSPNSGLAVAIGGRGPDSQTRSTVANSIGG